MQYTDSENLETTTDQHDTAKKFLFLNTLELKETKFPEPLYIYSIES